MRSPSSDNYRTAISKDCDLKGASEKFPPQSAKISENSVRGNLQHEEASIRGAKVGELQLEPSRRDYAFLRPAKSVRDGSEADESS